MNGEIVYDGWQQAIDYIVSDWESPDHARYDGIMGFSQGAAMAAALVGAKF